MAFKLPRIPRGMMPEPFCVFWDQVCRTIETQEAAQDELLAAVLAAQAAADAAQSAADTAQSAAETAQAAVDAIEVPPSGTRTVTASGPILDTDSTILVDASAGAVILSLPLATIISHSFTVQKIDASANTVTIDATGADSINGNPNIALTTQYEDVSLNSDGVSDWYAF